jgi:uncharacterized protein
MRDGLAYTLWLPEGEPLGGVVIIHGAGSAKESHHDYARAARAAGLAAVAFDQRGHGESGGALDHRALGDVATIASLLPAGPVALRGSSMGGWMALCAAAGVGAAAVVAICPAPSDGLLRGLRARSFEFEADEDALEALLENHSLMAAVSALDAPILFLHAEGDEQVPVQHTRDLAEHARHPDSRVIVAPGGHHRSVQHDEELQGESLRFIAAAFAAAPERA